MGYVSRQPGEEKVEAGSTAAGSGDGPDAGAGPERLEEPAKGRFVDVFEWAPDAREELAQQFAAAFVGNLSRPEGQDDVLIDEMFEQLGNSAVVSLLTGAEGRAGMLGRVLSATQLLRTRGEDLERIVDGSAAEMRVEAEAVDRMVLDGDLDGAAKRIQGGFDQLALSLESTARMSKLARFGRRELAASAKELAPVVRALSRGLDADLRAGRGGA